MFIDTYRRGRMRFCLLGCDMLSKLRLDWKTIGSVRLSQGKVQLNNLLKKYDSVF